MDTAPPLHFIYTAISGGRDSLKPQPLRDARYVAFLDHRPSGDTQWTYAPLAQLATHCRSAKHPKVLAHQALPEAEYSMWIDGSITLFPGSFVALVEQYLDGVDFALMRHPERDCIYDEGKVIMKRRLDPKPLVAAQLARYRVEGYPEHAGLSESGVILRRHTPAVREFELAWWEEIERGSRRDQVSFPYVAKKLGLRYRQIEGRPFFRVESHSL